MELSELQQVIEGIQADNGLVPPDTRPEPPMTEKRAEKVFVDTMEYVFQAPIVATPIQPFPAEMREQVPIWRMVEAGKTYDVNDTRAAELIRNGMKKNEHGRYHIIQRAELVEDLGRHIGRSKSTYDKNGSSDAFGPPGPDRPTALEKVMLQNAILERMIHQLNAGIKVYECKLCGYRNNPDIYGMNEIQGRWYHKCCLKWATWHQLKLIRAGKHKKVKKLKRFSVAPVRSSR